MQLGLLAILLPLAQQPEIQVHPDDPLHRYTRVEVGPEGASIEVTVGFTGTLHVWASSEAVDPTLRVKRGGEACGSRASCFSRRVV